MRDAFEFVTRVVTRNAYVIDRTLPLARLNPAADISYSFVISQGDSKVRAALNAGILPLQFFEFLAMKDKTADDLADFSRLRSAIAKHALAQDPASLFSLD